jgi:hypothetical protein
MLAHGRSVGYHGPRPPSYGGRWPVNDRPAPLNLFDRIPGKPMDKLLSPLLTQLTADSPLLLIYVVGIVLALVYWRRCRRPCAFTFFSCGLLLLTSIGQSAVRLYVFQGRADLDLSPEKLAWILTLIAQVSSCLRALGFGLLLAAIFVDRRPRMEYGRY